MLVMYGDEDGGEDWSIRWVDYKGDGLIVIGLISIYIVNDVQCLNRGGLT